MEDRDDLSTYPKGWIETQLGNIVNPSDKKVEPSTLQEVPYVGLEHIEKNTGRLLDFGNSSEVTSTKSKFYTGDLLYGKLRPYLNKVHCVNFEGVCSTDILVFSKQPYISNEFLSFRFLCKDFVSYASQNVNGVQHPRVNLQSLSEFPIYLPPLNEQRRIVAKIEALKARSQRVKEALEDIPQLLDQFRQSVLAAAFRGDLTADWREQNSNVEPAEVLLERIRAERRRRWEEGELEKMRASGKTPKDDKWKDKYEELSPIKQGNFSYLPNGWYWIRLKELASYIPRSLQSGPFGSNLLHSEFQSTGILAIGIDNVLHGTFSLGRENRISPEKYKELEKYTARPLDVLITVMSTVGRCCVVPPDIETAIITKHVYRISPDQEIINSYFLMNALRGSVEVIRQVKEQIRGQTRPGINGQILRNLVIPVPPRREQEEILNRIRVQSDTINQINKIIDDLGLTK